jgi:hypothetical protein
MGRPFTLRVSWPESAADYSGDIQTGADYWGSYTSEAITLDLDVAGHEFSAPPVIYRWETFDNAVLDYHLGTPLLSGDELRLVGRADWTRTLEFNFVDINGQPRSEMYVFDTEYQLSLRAIDETGGHFDDDSLQTEFDLTSFGHVRLELQQLVPVSGSDPRPIPYQHWLGVVDEIVAVPEPSAGVMAGVALAWLAICRWSRNPGC